MDTVLGRTNIRRVLALIRERPGISRSELARTLHLTKSSVSDAVQWLIDAGLVYDGGQGQTTAIGRKPRRLVFAQGYGQIIAVDLGGTTLRAAVVDLDGTVLARTQEPIHRRLLEDRLTRMIDQMLTHDTVGRPLAIGIGVAGTIDCDRGIVLDAPALERSNWDVTGAIRSAADLPVALDNDVNFAALGEQWKGAARGHANIVCLSIGTGIGAGLIINGQIYRGARGLAGEAGHLYQGSAPPDQAYDTFGDLELQAAGHGIARRAQDSIAPASSNPAPPASSSSKSPSPLSRAAEAEPVFLAADEGDRAAALIVEHAVAHLGIAVGNIISLLDPEMVVLLGGVGLGQAPRLLPAIRDVVQRITPPGSRGRVAIVVGALGDDAVLIGAACAAQQMLGLR